jgi:hypothetical protein
MNLLLVAIIGALVVTAITLIITWWHMKESDYNG